MCDLGPHPLSALQSLLPEARPIWEELRVSFSGYDARALFPVEPGIGRKRIPCEIYVHNVHEPPLNIRRFRLNDSRYDVEGYKDEQGVFQARIVGAQGAKDEEDAMRQLVRAFLAGAPVADARFALTNMEWLLRIREAGRKGS
jgi:hypothetical protein